MYAALIIQTQVLVLESSLEKTSCLLPIFIVSLFYSCFQNSGSDMENVRSYVDGRGEGNGAAIALDFDKIILFLVLDVRITTAEKLERTRLLGHPHPRPHLHPNHAMD